MEKIFRICQEPAGNMNDFGLNCTCPHQTIEADPEETFKLSMWASANFCKNYVHGRFMPMWFLNC